jgi:hypothetical protein
MNNHIFTPFVFTIALIFVSLYLSFGYLTITPNLEALGQSPSTVQITKDLTNSYTISSGSSEVGTFDTNYTIVGNMDAIKKEQKLIISTITEDFNKSPVIGYVKTANASGPHQQATLPNPFADNATVNQKIVTEINGSLSSPVNLNADSTTIQCNFGMKISEWNCKSN